MASTFTSNKIYELQGTGDNSGTWGTTLNSNPLTVIDLNFGGVLSLSLSSSNVTLTSTQARNAIVLLGGAISANLTITFPAVGSTYTVKNGTSGAFTITLACAGAGSSVTLEQGSTCILYTDATNAGYANSRSTFTAVASLTDGATPALNAALGGVFLLTSTTNPTIAVPTNPTSGQKIVIAFTASGGARTLALNTGAGGFRYGTDIAALTATTSGKTDYVGAIYNLSATFWDVWSYVKGF